MSRRFLIAPVRVHGGRGSSCPALHALLPAHHGTPNGKRRQNIARACAPAGPRIRSVGSYVRKKSLCSPENRPSRNNETKVTLSDRFSKFPGRFYRHFIDIGCGSSNRANPPPCVPRSRLGSACIVKRSSAPSARSAHGRKLCVHGLPSSVREPT